jgi:ribosomal protein S6--L-glutamate ligase
MDEGTPDLYYRGKAIQAPDAILPRVGTSITRYGTTVVRQFEQMDVYTPNTSSGIGNSRDKLRSLQIIARAGVGLPKTIFTNYYKDVEHVIESVGGAPLVLK